MKRMTMKQLADKVEWEGGIMDAITYGIKSTEVPLTIEAEWKKAEALLEQLDPIVDEIVGKIEMEI